MTTFYEQYVNHMLRFYIRNPVCMSKETPDVTNYLAVMQVFTELSEPEKQTLTAVYTKNGNLANIIHCHCRQNKIPPKDVWGLVNRVTRRVAEERGLV